MNSFGISRLFVTKLSPQTDFGVQLIQELDYCIFLCLVNTNRVQTVHLFAVKLCSGLANMMGSSFTSPSRGTERL